MLQKKDVAIGIVVSYVFLLTLLFVLSKSKSIDTPCSFYEPCVRFCCQDMKSCNDSVIRETFNNSGSVNFEGEFTVLHGKPTCSLLPAEDKKWKFDYGYLSIEDDDFEELYYDDDEYCFEESINDDEVTWKLMLCQHHLHFKAFFTIFTSTVTIVISFATVFAYAYFEELKTAPGRCFLLFAVSLFMTFVSCPFLEYDYRIISHVAIFLYSSGLFFSYLWSVVMVFDVWWKFWFFQTPTDDLARFKYYCYFVYGFSAFLCLSAFASNFHKLLEYAFLFFLITLFMFSIADICFIVMTVYKILKLSKVAIRSEDSRFEAEKERFWSYIQLLLVMFVIWFIEVFSWHSVEETAYIIELLKCLSAVTVFTIFVLNKNIDTSILKRYRMFQNANTLTPENV